MNAACASDAGAAPRERSPLILLCPLSNRRSDAVSRLLIGRDGGRCHGNGERTGDFSKRPTDVMNTVT